MRFPFRPGIDPIFYRFDLFRREFPVGVGWRHAKSRIGITDPPVHLAVRRITRHNHALLRKSAFFRIEMKAGHAVPFIRAMAGETVIGQDRANLPVEVDCRRRRLQQRQIPQN